MWLLCMTLLMLLRRHAKELQQQAANAAAAAEAAAPEAAALAARYDSTIVQLQKVLEQQGAEAGRQLAELHARAEQQQQRLAELTQQLLSLLQLPQQQCLQQSAAAAGQLHQTYAASPGGAGSGNGSPLRNSSAQQQQWQGSPTGHGSPRRLTPQHQQQQAALPAEVQELCSTLWAAVGSQSQPEEAAGAVHALISGLTQACVGLMEQAAELEATLAEAQAENEQLLADGTALAGGTSMLCVTLLHGKLVQWYVVTVLTTSH